MPAKPRSVSTIEADLEKVNGQRDVLKKQARELTAEYDAAAAVEAAAVSVAGMSDAERSAYAQAIKAS